jgi:hypothetical protein
MGGIVKGAPSNSILYIPSGYSLLVRKYPFFPVLFA